MARVKTLAGLPITQYDSPNKGGTMSEHRGVVLHIAQGYYQGTIAWQMNPDQRYANGTRVTTSSTWVVGKQRGEWAQMVDTARVAWTQQAGSTTWLSIELAGWAPEAPTGWQVEACAQLLAWAHRTHGIPLLVANHPGERGLGHHSMDREWLGEDWGHESCPGSGVVAAKPAIVKRAREIVEEDDMPSAKDIAAELARNTSFLDAVSRGVWARRQPSESKTAGEDVTYADCVRGRTARWDALRASVAAILAAVTDDDADLATVLARVDQVAAEASAERSAALADVVGYLAPIQAGVQQLLTAAETAEGGQMPASAVATAAADLAEQLADLTTVGR